MKGKRSYITAIILAGGYSRRIKLKIPKQLIEINARPLLAYTLDVFQCCKEIERIVLVVNRKYLTQYGNLVRRYGYSKVKRICPGGRTRQLSVLRGLQTISNCNYVIIHDGVRPFVSIRDIIGIIKQVKRAAAVTSAVKATDTIVEKGKYYIKKTLYRDSLWHIQTPQAFKFDLIYNAHQRAKKMRITNASDDAQLVMAMGEKVKIVQGSYQNIKISTVADISLARHILQKKTNKF